MAGLTLDELKDKRLLTVEEAARYLSFRPGSLYNRICPGTKDRFPVEPVRIGRAIRFDRLDLDAWINSLKVNHLNVVSKQRIS